MSQVSVVVTVEPTAEPVTIQEVQAHLRVDSDDDEDVIAALAVAARQWCEEETNRQFCPATLRTRLSGFPAEGAILLPRSPAVAVSSVAYLDGAGASQTLGVGNYVVSVDAVPPQVSLAPGASWPSTAEQADAVTIIYTAGYATVPGPIRQAILLQCQLLYDRDPKEREMLEMARDALLSPYRVYYF